MAEKRNAFRHIAAGCHVGGRRFTLPPYGTDSA